MDRQVEDKMVKQIEKNLSNNFNTDLLYTGQNYGRNSQTRYSMDTKAVNTLPVEAVAGMDNPILSFEYSNPMSISRAEYIRQAREACLRQLSELQSTARAYDSYYLDTSVKNIEEVPQYNNTVITEKDDKPEILLQENTVYQEELDMQENMREIMAFRLLIIRMVCAIVIFLSIFLIDKFNFKIGSFQSENIQEYVTGNDTLDSLENMIVTLLKK